MLFYYDALFLKVNSDKCKALLINTKNTIAVKVNGQETGWGGGGAGCFENRKTSRLVPLRIRREMSVGITEQVNPRTYKQRHTPTVGGG